MSSPAFPIINLQRAHGAFTWFIRIPVVEEILHLKETFNSPRTILISLPREALSIYRTLNAYNFVVFILNYRKCYRCFFLVLNFVSVFKWSANFASVLFGDCVCSIWWNMNRKMINFLVNFTFFLFSLFYNFDESINQTKVHDIIMCKCFWELRGS